ncbi:MAG: isoamylase [Chloroflexota bacterium]|nr:isoamylase [Chloroflexota bacterium]MDQ5865366.1 isoamylase [Chloroflexota bacterium]
MAGPPDWDAIAGSPGPLGVTWIEEESAFNFALYSRYASTVTLLLFSSQDFATPVFQLNLDPLKNKSGPTWHCRIPLAATNNATYYGYMVNGPSAPDPGERFDREKVLLDPYAMGVLFPPNFSRTAASRPGSNAGRAPLGVLRADAAPFEWGDDRRPHHTSDLIIYEMHVKGFTARDNSGVSAEKRGTFAGVVEKIPYLQELGVTAVELMPIHQYDPLEGNYWGYMTLNFFSPHQSYSVNSEPAEAFNEFRDMVKALHSAGIEVILDVVYNHTTELDESGPNYSYRGIANSAYYLLEKDMRTYRDDAGTGNVLRCAHPYVRKLVVDSLRFWVKEMHVDGFRFDLASIFTRGSDGSILEDPPVMAEISNDVYLDDTRLIAEAWDMTSYQLGRAFPGTSWLQWNGKFRDDIRSVVKSDPGRIADLIRRLYGSDDLFPDALLDSYHPYQSVNFITAHDGFCLYDLVSYNNKHNEANGHNNRDGTDANISWNCGWEGDENVPPQVVELRKQQVKNFCCLLLLANGTPMLVAGDEFMNTQRGNNNPYNQDNEISWLDWDLLTKNQDIFRFFKKMIAFRKAHPSLSRSGFWRADVAWYGVQGQADLSFNSHTLAFCLRGASQQDVDIYVMINTYWQDLVFTVQEGQAAEWRRIVDTGLQSPQDFLEPDQVAPLQDLNYPVKARSIVVLSRS